MMLLPGLAKNEIMTGAKKKKKNYNGYNDVWQWKALGSIFSIKRECKGQDYSLTVIEILVF